MNGNHLREMLLETPAPGEKETQARGLEVAHAAFAEREPQQRRRVLPRLGVAFSAGLLAAALALSPAGAEVRRWIGDAFSEVPKAEHALTEVPGGGRLLVQSQDGPWVVQPDGSRRLLGRYDDATWSPRGLFVAAVSGNTLSAVEPDGDPRWAISSNAPLADPRWSPSRFRIAYRAGHELRVIAADGTGESLVDPQVAPVPPAWLPLGLNLLAYVDSAGGLRIVNTDTGETLDSAKALTGIEALDWAADGSSLLEKSRRSLRIRQVHAGKLMSDLKLGAAKQIALPAGASVAAAASSPVGKPVAASLELPGIGKRPPHSEITLIAAGRASRRPLFSAPGRLSDLTWSPDGTRLLISWRETGQWLFIPTRGGGHVDAFSEISREFAPGDSGPSFPSIDGWCCTPSFELAG